MKIRILEVARPELPLDAIRVAGIEEQVLPTGCGVERVAVDAAGDREAFLRALVEPADFVAIHVEGDTWTDEHKLARQVAWLRGHAECPGCFHPVESGASLGETSSPGSEPVSVSDLASDPVSGVDELIDRSDADRFDLDDVWTVGGLVPPSSLVFRGSALSSVPDWFESPIASLGFSLPVLLAAGGALGRLDDALAARTAETGETTGGRGLASSERELLERRYVNAKLGFRYEGAVERFVAKQGIELARRCLDAGDVSDARRHWGRAFAHLPFATAFGSGLLPLRLAVTWR